MSKTSASVSTYIIRNAETSDCQVLVQLMRDSAEEQHKYTHGQITAEDLERDVFQKPSTFTIFVSQRQEGTIIGYLVSYYGFSTIVGRTIYIEDIFVIPSFRRKGVALALWKKLSQVALVDGCVRCDIITKSPTDFLLRCVDALDMTLIEGDLFFKINEEVMKKYTRSSKPIERIHFRKAKKSDCPELLANIKCLNDYLDMFDVMEVDSLVLEREGFGDKPLYESFVAENDGVIAGYAIFYFTYHLNGFGVFLEDLYVSPDFKGKGIGTVLLGEVIKACVDKGGRLCMFAVDSVNTSAINFYKSKGAVDATNCEGYHFFKITKTVMEQFAGSHTLS